MWNDWNARRQDALARLAADVDRSKVHDHATLCQMEQTACGTKLEPDILGKIQQRRRIHSCAIANNLSRAVAATWQGHFLGRL